MTTSDVDRLYNGLAEVASEVREYRKELNGRLRKLEESEARRDGATAGRAGIGKFVMSVAATAAAIGSVCGAIVALW